jgi:hypothetical protein
MITETVLALVMFGHASSLYVLPIVACYSGFVPLPGSNN